LTVVPIPIVVALIEQLVYKTFINGGRLNGKKTRVLAVGSPNRRGMETYLHNKRHAKTTATN
jgi:hypothetical protein